MLVVTPVAIVTVQAWYALSVAVAADRVSVAVAVPELAFATVNVVLPQVSMGVANVPNWNVGSSSAMVSGVVISSGEFNVNKKVSDDGA